MEEVTHKVFFDVEIDNQPAGGSCIHPNYDQETASAVNLEPKANFSMMFLAGRLVIGLFGKAAPKTVGTF